MPYVFFFLILREAVAIGNWNENNSHEIKNLVDLVTILVAIWSPAKVLQKNLRTGQIVHNVVQFCKHPHLKLHQKCIVIMHQNSKYPFLINVKRKGEIKTLLYQSTKKTPEAII